jgi:hypothetical protein
LGEEKLSSVVVEPGGGRSTLSTRGGVDGLVSDGFALDSQMLTSFRHETEFSTSFLGDALPSPNLAR